MYGDRGWVVQYALRPPQRRDFAGTDEEVRELAAMEELGMPQYREIALLLTGVKARKYKRWRSCWRDGKHAHCSPGD